MLHTLRAEILPASSLQASGVLRVGVLLVSHQRPAACAHAQGHVHQRHCDVETTLELGKPFTERSGQ